MATPAPKLTDAELVVLWATADGKTAKEIAAARGTSTRTVEY